MAYITEADLTSVIKSDNLTAIIDTDASALDTAIAETESICYNFLFDRYEIAAELAKTGTDRNAMLVKICKDLIIYQLYTRLPKSKTPEHRVKSYEWAMLTLNQLAAGEISLQIDRKTDPDNKIRYGFATAPRLD